MELTKQLEEEVMQVYDTWLNSYLSGDVKTYDHYFDDDYHFIGSTGNEEFLNRRETTKFFEVTANQLANKTAIRNSSKTIELFGELIFITQLLDAWFLNGTEWAFYGRFRFTSVLRKNKDGWRFIYQHFSTPDLKATEGETIGYEKISAENLELREAVKRRTIELEQKNRELEIEAALEKVRSRSLAMNNSEEILEVVKIMYDKLKELNVEIEAVTILILHEDKLEYWIANDDNIHATKYIEILDLNEQEAANKEFIINWKLKQDYEACYGYKDKNKHWNRLFSQTDFKKFPSERKQFILDALYYNVALSFAEKVATAFVRYYDKKYSGDEKQVLKKFNAVFDQAYTRFLDLQKAEAQTREAQIETAVERVRAQSMAMYKTSDLYKVNEEILSQLNKLKVDGLSGVSIYLVDENDIVTVWDLSSPGNISNLNSYSFKYDAKKYPILGGWVEQWKTSKQYYFVLDFPKQVLIEGIKELKEILPEMAVLLSNAIESGKLQHQWSPAGRLSDGILAIDLIIPPTEDTKNIVSKMAGAFNLAYQRFLDLQKAEAQTREAQIESSLERVRSKTMAMHNSKDVGESVATLFDELSALGLLGEHDRCGIGIMQPNEIMEAWTASKMDNTTAELTIGHINMSGHSLLLGAYNGWKDKKEIFQYLLEGGDKQHYYNAINNQSNYKINFDYFSLTPKIVHTSFYFNEGCLYVFSQQNFPFEISNVFIRFAYVFGQTYRRYLDLQKAEAQTREAQIQLALERVRARTMAMQKQEDLFDVAIAFGNQLVAIGLKVDYVSFMDGLISKKRDWNLWGCVPGLENSAQNNIIPYRETVYFTRTDQNIDAYEKTGNPIQVKSFTKEEKNEFLDYYFSVAQPLPEDFKKIVYDAPGSIIVDAFLSEVTVSICKYDEEKPYTNEQLDIFKRFSQEFRQAYIRFLDLQKAEAQAREAQLEASLEKVRSVAMSMHHSNELLSICESIYAELIKLGITELRNTMINIHNDAEETFLNYDYSAYAGRAVTKYGYHIHPMINHLVMQCRSTHDAFIDIAFAGKEFEEWRSFRKSSGEKDDKRLNSINHLHYYFYSIGIGSIGISTFESIDEKKLALLKRFRNVFQLAYQRFTDLTAAEAQAREAQIEAALERVRSKTMAMHKSEQLPETAQVLFEQFAELGKIPDRISIGIVKEETQVIEWWVTDQSGSQLTSHFDSTILEPTIAQLFNAWKGGKDELKIKLTGKALNEWIAYVRDNVKMPIDESKMKGRRVHHAAFFSQGMLLISAHEQMPEETLKLLVRFAKVFSQTYTRFLDLQKAEAQAREAMIEAALERVRSEAMSMHNSNDLPSTAIIAFTELKKLGFVPIRCGISIHNKENRKNLLYSATTSDQGDNLSIVGWAILDNHPVLTEAYNRWLKGEDFFPELDGKLLKSYYKEVRKSFEVPIEQTEQKQFGYFMYFTNGAFYGWCEKPVSEEEKKLLRRFASVIDLTFKRYFDLQNAEARALIAIREASLDRVRGEIASMRTTEDLQRITPLIWRELLALGVPFFRCGLMIVEEEKEIIHFYLSTPDGKPLAALELPFHSINVTTEALANWRLQKVYTTHWSKEEFISFATSLFEQGQIKNTSTYQGGEEAPASLTLQFVPFKQGMLYIGSEFSLSEIQIESTKSIADAFSTAYARYEDFNKLETAKQVVEKTLEELKETQKQLIQSEKMASLGELTAGIAHEIQNPLNFVNNFSEVSGELISEMVDEVGKGNYDEVKAIANDVKQNLEKINHHGKRAADIVKGMLQHSRSSSGAKEPTDINALCDEYLRLSYHGLRAKDKSFNATMKTNFDETIGNINIIPQDIGRVVLNLINNAFYAVGEKLTIFSAAAESKGYEPTVTISTKKVDNKIEISVTDNGNGIPQKILEKIFQPFFTTKPTGQGTGLGLSLSYDIVKAHGGELKVETKEGDGTSFIISLSV